MRIGDWDWSNKNTTTDINQINNFSSSNKDNHFIFRNSINIYAQAVDVQERQLSNVSEHFI